MLWVQIPVTPMLAVPTLWAPIPAPVTLGTGVLDERVMVW